MVAIIFINLIFSIINELTFDFNRNSNPPNLYLEMKSLSYFEIWFHLNNLFQNFLFIHKYKFNWNDMKLVNTRTEKRFYEKKVLSE